MSLPASLQKNDHRIFLEGEHQAAVVYLGQLALSGSGAADLATQAAVIISQVLQAEYSLIWGLKEGGQDLFLWGESVGIGNSPTFPSFRLLPNSLEEATLSSIEPVIFEKSKHNLEISFGDSIAMQAVENGISLRLGTMDKPSGILQVFSAQGQCFSQDDIHFLQSIANILSMVLPQGCCTQESATRSLPAIKTKSALQSDYLEWDQYEIKNCLVESQERERLRLAQNLHDVPIQELYGMIYQLDDLRDIVMDTDGEKILDECDHSLRRVVKSLRTICRELRPPSLSPFGLEVAIRDHVEKFRDQNPDIRVHLELMQDGQVLSDSMRLSLFRIYQQAIHNVSRHAQASEVHIRFRWDKETTILEVEDNGIGFEVPENWLELVNEEHFGLLGMAERIESLRGKLEIVSAVGNGTLVRAIAPYSSLDLG
jgi:signal transduction histidine kinase